MADENQRQDNNSESISAGACAAKQADDAIRETAQEYLDKTSIKLDLKQLEKTIRERPLVAAGIATAVGFVVGGGLASSVGLGLLALFGRDAARQTASNFMGGIVKGVRTAQ